MTAEWCTGIVKEAIGRHGKQEIINSDQGSQFTSEQYTHLLMDNEIQISMNGRKISFKSVCFLSYILQYKIVASKEEVEF